MLVSQLFIYPIKGLGGIALQQSQVLQRGLQYDRRYMLVDKNGKFITQRTMPQLTLFKLKWVETGFEVSYKNSKTIIPFYVNGTKITVTVWDDILQATLADEAFNMWFSDALDNDVRLVFMDDDDKRPINPKYAVSNEQVSFADGYPILLLSIASMEMLNAKVDVPIEIQRFRPNIVISGATPHQEDKFTFFSINKVKFKAVKPCARCVVTTINLTTATFGKEPLKTLAQYRNINNNILFGVNVICLSNGKIAIGMELQLG